jgi:hypothetical protein
MIQHKYCFVCRKHLGKDPAAIAVVTKHFPEATPSTLENLCGKQVCPECAGELKKIGFRMFNLGQALEREWANGKQMATEKIEALLAHKGKTLMQVEQSDSG